MVDGAVVEAINATDPTSSSLAAQAASPNDRGTVVLADSNQFIRPDRDLREYRIIKLQNNLEALLVSTAKTAGEDDDSAKVEAASMHIQAGHFDDTLPGLAHFYEHMLVSKNFMRGVYVNVVCFYEIYFLTIIGLVSRYRKVP